MAESFYEKRRRELGLVTETASTQSTAVKPKESSSEPSFYESRRMDLGIIPDTRPKQAAPELEPAASHLPKETPGVLLKNAQQRLEANSKIQGPPVVAKTTTTEKSKPKSKGLAAAMAGDLGELLNHVTFGASEPLTKRFENYITNENTATKVQPGQLDPKKQEIAKTISGLAGDLGAGGAAYKVAKTAVAPLARRLPGLIERAAAPVANRLSPTLGAATRVGAQQAGKVAGVAATGAAAGTLFQAPREVSEAVYGTNDQTIRQRLGDVGVAAGLGVVGDPIIQAYGESIGPALKNLITRKKAVSPDTENAVNNALNRKIGVAYGKLTPASNESYINKVMGDIGPIVTEQMTPPLENPRALAKWLKPHLGDASLNEINKLSYEDMRQLATEVKNNLSTYDLAKAAAKQRGYDLDKLLNNQTPNLKQTAERLRMGRVAGAIEPPKQNVRLAAPRAEGPVPKPENPQNADAMKGNWFTNLFGNQGLGISAASSAGRSTRGPLSTADQLVRKGIRNDAEGLKASAAAQARASYQNMVDRLEPLKTVSKQTYDTAMDASRSNNLANTIVRDKLVDLQGNVVGNSLQDVFRKVARGQDKQFIDYLTLRHAKTRMERGERVYAENLEMTPDKVQDRINMYDQRHPGFSDIAKEWDQFNTNVLKTFGVNEGLISPEMYNALRTKNPNYSPMRRQFLRSEKPGRKFLQSTSKSAFSGQKAPIKEVSPTGSVRNIVDPRRSTIESVAAWTNAALRNRTMQSMVDAIKRDPEGFKGVAEIVQKPKSKTDLKQILKDGDEDDFIEALDGDFKDLFKTSKVDGDNIVRAMVKGEPVYIKVHDPEVVKTLIGLGPENSNLLVDILDVLSRATKRGATGILTPMFAVKSATMDIVQSAIQAKNPAKQAAYTVYSILSGIGDRLNIPGLRNWAQEYRRAGGNFSNAMKADRRINKGISSMTRYPLLSPQNLAKQTGRTIAFPFKLLDAIGDIGENAPRIAAAKQELQRSGGVRTPETVRNAMSAGREATVNYSRKGAYSHTLESAIPYNNAAIQGMYRMGRAFKKNPIRTTAMVGALVVVPKLYEYSQFHDDPDYVKLPAREKYRNLIVHKNADGTFVKVPMSPEYNSIGQFVVESLLKWRDMNPDAFKGSMDALANSYTPPLVSGALQGETKGTGPEGSIAGAFNSTVAAPFTATVANRSFTGAPIVPERLSENSPGQQYDERTSSVAKYIGQHIGMSPMKVDYLIRAYGGDPARLVLPLTSGVGQGTPKSTLLKNFIADPVFTNTLSEDYYKLQGKIVNAESNNRTNGKEFPDWYNKNTADYVTSLAKGKPAKRLSLLSTEKRNVQADKSLSAKDKSQKLRDIQAEMNEIYLDGIMTMQESGVPK